MKPPADPAALLRRELAEVTAERDALAAQLAGDLPAVTAWLQAKVWRQRRALDLVTRRNTTLRFALRLHDQVHGALTTAEWAAARAGLADAGHRGRVAETVPAVA